MNADSEQHAKRRKWRWLSFLRRVDREIQPTHADAPSFHDGGVVVSQEPMDELDEASMESFPASDPPALHRKEQA